MYWHFETSCYVLHAYLQMQTQIPESRLYFVQINVYRLFHYCSWRCSRAQVILTIRYWVLSWAVMFWNLHNNECIILYKSRSTHNLVCEEPLANYVYHIPSSVQGSFRTRTHLMMLLMICGRTQVLLVVCKLVCPNNELG